MRVTCLQLVLWHLDSVSLVPLVFFHNFSITSGTCLSVSTSALNQTIFVAWGEFAFLEHRASVNVYLENGTRNWIRESLSLEGGFLLAHRASINVYPGLIQKISVTWVELASWHIEHLSMSISGLNQRISVTWGGGVLLLAHRASFNVYLWVWFRRSLLPEWSLLAGT